MPGEKLEMWPFQRPSSFVTSSPLCVHTCLFYTHNQTWISYVYSLFKQRQLLCMLLPCLCWHFHSRHWPMCAGPPHSLGDAHSTPCSNTLGWLSIISSNICNPYHSLETYHGFSALHRLAELCPPLHPLDHPLPPPGPLAHSAPVTVACVVPFI